MTGLADVSGLALRHALKGDPAMVAADVAWLDDGQLRALITASGLVRDAAQAELDGRTRP